jgi:hypothetical protein
MFSGSKIAVFMRRELAIMLYVRALLLRPGSPLAPRFWPPALVTA